MLADEEKIMKLNEHARRIEHIRRKRVAGIVTAAGVIGCLVVFVVLADILSGIYGTSLPYVQDSGMYASIFSSTPALGYIVIGLMAFVMGILMTSLCHRLRKWTKDYGRDY